MKLLHEIQGVITVAAHIVLHVLVVVPYKYPKTALLLVAALGLIGILNAHG